MWHYDYEYPEIGVNVAILYRDYGNNDDRSLYYGIGKYEGADKGWWIDYHGPAYDLPWEVEYWAELPKLPEE